jgi:Tol biopolymer transport system component
MRRSEPSWSPDGSLSWSPDGEFLVFSRYSEHSVEIWSVKKDGTDPND